MWRKVSEERPPVDSEVLVLFRGERRIAKRIQPSSGWLWQIGVNWYGTQEVTQWHPLPELPVQTTASAAEVEEE